MANTSLIKGKVNIADMIWTANPPLMAENLESILNISQAFWLYRGTYSTSIASGSVIAIIHKAFLWVPWKVFQSRYAAKFSNTGTHEWKKWCGIALL